MTCWYVGFSDGELYFHGKENINDNNYWWRTKKEGGKKNGEMNVAVQMPEEVKKKHTDMGCERSLIYWANKMYISALRVNSFSAVEYRTYQMQQNNVSMSLNILNVYLF